MMIEARIDLYEGAVGPDPWDERLNTRLPLDHIICRDVDGMPCAIGEFIWPWTAYTAHRTRLLLHFYYWGRLDLMTTISKVDIAAERVARMRELQFLMTRQIYYGNDNAPTTLYAKLALLRYLARFAEAQSCSVRDVLIHTTKLDAFGEYLSDSSIELWVSLLKSLRQLDPETQLGFSIAPARRWKDVQRRAKEYAASRRQCAPLPTRIYAALINNVAAELDVVEESVPRLVAALREAIAEYWQAKATKTGRDVTMRIDLIEKYSLAAYFERRGYCSVQFPLRSLAGAVGEIFQLCKLQIHLFSGMRDAEARHLPYHCAVSEKGLHGRTHHLIVGTTTKLNRGRRLRTKWVTTENDGLRAIRLARTFADVIYEVIGITPSDEDDLKDNYPLFPSNEYLPWLKRRNLQDDRVAAIGKGFPHLADSLLPRLCPRIEEEDVEELEAIDAFRAWREEGGFAVGHRWPLTTHQLRRSLAVYANASGLVRLSSLRRQLQHLTREMAMYYGRGSTFCKSFIEDDPVGYRKHIAVDWQEGAEEAEMLAFVRDVLNSTEPMFGAAGTFYEHQRERGEVMSREQVSKQMKAGLLAYRDGPLGGCTRPGVCETRKGLNLIDTVCATDGCKHLIGKHSRIVQTIRLKRAAMTHITPGSITEAMEREELKALEQVERAWRSEESPAAACVRGGNA